MTWAGCSCVQRQIVSHGLKANYKDDTGMANQGPCR